MSNITSFTINFNSVEELEYKVSILTEFMNLKKKLEQVKLKREEIEQKREEIEKKREEIEKKREQIEKKREQIKQEHVKKENYSNTTKKGHEDMDRFL